MGYTHYWYFPSTYEVDTKTWKKIVDDFNKILDMKAWNEFPNAFGKEHGTLRDILEPSSGQKLAITDDMIWFNGREENDQGHETFHLERKSTKESYRTFPLKDQDGKILEDTEKEECFTFCKTARKPYDIVVCCCLLIAKKHLGGLISVSSDGDEVEWNDAINLCQKHLGYNEEFSFDKEGKLKISIGSIGDDIASVLERQGVKLS